MNELTSAGVAQSVHCEGVGTTDGEKKQQPRAESLLQPGEQPMMSKVVFDSEMLRDDRVAHHSLHPLHLARNGESREDDFKMAQLAEHTEAV